MNNDEIHQNTEEDAVYSLDILEIWNVIKKFKLTIIICSIIGILAGTSVALFFTKTTYTSGTVVYVKSREDLSTNKNANLVYSDLQAARNVATTCVEITKLLGFSDAVAKKVSGGYTPGKIHSMLSSSVLNETELVAISVTAPTNDEAYDIAKAVEEVVPGYLIDILKEGNVSVVESAQYPNSPNGKGMSRKALIGLAGGLVLGIFIVLFRYFYGDRISNADDLRKRYALPLLSVVPILEEQHKERM